MRGSIRNSASTLQEVFRKEAESVALEKIRRVLSTSEADQIKMLHTL